LRPTERFFSLRTEAWHFLHLVAWSGFRAPHLRQTWKKRRLFCAICFLTESAIGKDYFSRHPQVGLMDFSLIDMVILNLCI